MKTFFTLLLLFIGLPFTGRAQEADFVKGADVGFLQGQEPGTVEKRLSDFGHPDACLGESTWRRLRQK